MRSVENFFIEVFLSENPGPGDGGETILVSQGREYGHFEEVSKNAGVGRTAPGALVWAVVWARTTTNIGMAKASSVANETPQNFLLPQQPRRRPH